MQNDLDLHTKISYFTHGVKVLGKKDYTCTCFFLTYSISVMVYILYI